MKNNTVFKACAFTGHRPSKLPWDYDEKAATCMEFKFRLREALEYLIGKGYVDFLSGGALRFDLIAAEMVLSLREKYLRHHEGHQENPGGGRSYDRSHDTEALCQGQKPKS